MPKFSATMLDNSHYKRKNKGVCHKNSALNAILNAKNFIWNWPQDRTIGILNLYFNFMEQAPTLLQQHQAYFILFYEKHCDAILVILYVTVQLFLEMDIICACEIHSNECQNDGSVEQCDWSCHIKRLQNSSYWWTSP